MLHTTNTKCFIAIENKNGTINYVKCTHNWDYLQFGRELSNLFNTKNQARKLFSKSNPFKVDRLSNFLDEAKLEITRGSSKNLAEFMELTDNSETYLFNKNNTWTYLEQDPHNFCLYWFELSERPDYDFYEDTYEDLDPSYLEPMESLLAHHCIEDDSLIYTSL